jgi:hypothetical protein
MTVFWDVAPYSLDKFTDVSEVLVASVIRVMTQLQLKYLTNPQHLEFQLPLLFPSLALTRCSAVTKKIEL